MDPLLHAVYNALPADMEPEDLWRCAPPRWWNNRPWLAISYALRTCPRLNWQAYASRYLEVKRSGMDPWLHFMQRGIQEGKMLFSWHPLKQVSPRDAPCISVNVISNASLPFLIKCLESVRAQTLKNIEINVAYRAAYAETFNEIAKIAAGDQRIRMVMTPDSANINDMRRTCAFNSSGIYVMFLDSGNYLEPNACEIAYQAVIDGYDAASFDASVIPSRNCEMAGVHSFSSYFPAKTNVGKTGEEIWDAIFLKESIPSSFWNKIYLREICQEAFNKVGNCGSSGLWDMAIVAEVAKLTRCLNVVNKKIVVHQAALHDAPVGSDYCAAAIDDILQACKFVIDGVNNERFKRRLSHLCSNFLEKLFSFLLSSSASIHYYSLFERLYEAYGFENVMKFLMSKYQDKIRRVAEIYDYSPPKRKIKHIGIYYLHLTPGGAQTVVRALCQMLCARGFAVTLFLEELPEYEENIPPGVSVVHIHGDANAGPAMLAHFSSLHAAIQGANLDLMIYAATWQPCLFWDMLLLHHYGIPVIMNHHGDFTLSFLRDSVSAYAVRDVVFSRADAMTCLSSASQLYYRSQKCNAWLVSNPVPQHEYIVRQYVPQKIAICARLDDNGKQMGESLKVVAEAVKLAPWLKACFIGGFKSPQNREKFDKVAAELNLTAHISISDWTSQPGVLMESCGVLLSTSFSESFGLAIAEAQALGLPCVIYDIPIEQVNGNESIIAVPQGDCAAAAEKIVEILSDAAKWQSLSKIAYTAASRYSPEAFEASFMNLIDNFQDYSLLENFNFNDYRNVLEYGAFYAAKNMPTRFLGELG